MSRRYPVGAEIVSSSAISVRIWAPDHPQLSVVVDGRRTPLTRGADGYHEAVVDGRAGSRYGFRIGDDEKVYPDPASRSQPEGPHGPSEVIDPTTFLWRDDAWTGIGRSGQVLYELHIGTFTREGTWRAAAARLPALAELGITTIQMMPIAEFDGAFGWGYDGVSWFAPSHLYGRPDDLRAFVDRAHELGLAVILDVVYNHLGPSGNYLPTFARGYFTAKYDNEWGDAINFDGADAGPVREMVLANGEYWVREFHVDGYRLDATQQIFDESQPHILEAFSTRVRGCTSRQVFISGENEPQQAQLMRPPSAGGYGLDALYNDDFHHSARVALTGIREAYYTDYDGSARELLAAVRWGFLYQGQHYSWQKNGRGTPAFDCAPEQFVCFLENHDQVANSGLGARLADLTAPGDLRALTALLLLAPSTPMLFQGQERGARAPWRYFAAHEGTLGDQVRKGRLEFLEQFERLATDDMVAMQHDPTARQTFEESQIADELDERGRQLLALHRDLLTLRAGDPVFGHLPRRRPEGAMLSAGAFVLRAEVNGDTRLVVVNLGHDLKLARVSEPLVVPPEGRDWRVLWSSEHPAYGGSGMPRLAADTWRMPGHAVTVLAPATMRPSSPSAKS